MNGEDENLESSSDIDSEPPGSTSQLSPVRRDKAEQVKREVLVEALLASKFSGPLPPAKELKAYDLVLPGLAERIVSMAERQSQHRMELEKVVIEGDVKRANWGLFLAALIAFGSLGASVYLALNERETTATALVGTSLIAVVGAFIYGSKNRRDERINKQEKLLKAGNSKEN